MESKDIIKALEHCTSLNADCRHCDKKITENCITFLMRDALFLIYQQQAEIEKLQQNLKEAHIDIEEHIAEIDRLKQRQTPKKPTYEETNNIYGALKRTCANCGDVCFISEDAKPFEHYCRNCGQALDCNEQRKED